MVECNLAKVEVAGSNPVSRSNLFLMATWPSGKAEVCKTSISSSNLDVASSKLTLRRF